LYRSGHNKGDRGYGAQWGGQTATYHHNLLAHNYNRSPRFNGARSNDLNVLIDFVNNVNYNWGKQNSCYGGDITNQTHRANLVNNYYKPGPARPATSTSYFVEASYGNNSSKVAVWWLSGNVMEGNNSMIQNNFSGLLKNRYPSDVRDRMEASGPFEVPYPVTTETAEEAYVSVLAGAGAFPRDVVDTRIVNEVREGTASGSGAYGRAKGIIDDPEEVGGYPEYDSTEPPLDSDHDGMPNDWEISKGLNPNSPDDGKKLTKSGYTALEVYLNGLVGEDIPLEFDNASIADIQQNINVTVFVQNNKLLLNSNLIIKNVEILNPAGTLLRKVSLSNIQAIDISYLTSGLYIAKLETDTNNSIVRKFIKMN
jgi:hypothetical protein